MKRTRRPPPPPADRQRPERAEADRIVATKDELVARATADYMAAREDDRIIEAGPGRFGRKAAKVERGPGPLERGGPTLAGRRPARSALGRRRRARPRRRHR